MEEHIIEKAKAIYDERSDELRHWVVERYSYGGAGAINGPVCDDQEKWTRRYMIYRALYLAKHDG